MGIGAHKHYAIIVYATRKTMLQTAIVAHCLQTDDIFTLVILDISLNNGV